MLSRLLCIFCLFALTGCEGKESSLLVTDVGRSIDADTEKKTSNVADLPAATVASKTPQERAVLAKEALFNELSTRLLAAMSNGGPAKAIEVCSQLAPKLAKDVGEQHQVSIGRTAVRLRNANNLPPEWAEPLLADLPTKPVFKEFEDGRTGGLFPIMLKVQCLTCHGPDDKIAPEIRAELARLYPNDKATGFQEGDLRGWFWVEVPSERDNAVDSETGADAN